MDSGAETPLRLVDFSPFPGEIDLPGAAPAATQVASKAPASRETVADRFLWLRFFDAFFQERNIQWILGVGMLILLGSSLMLVTSHWDTYTPLWKHLILLGYTVGLHAVGQAAYRWLGLRKTGAGLMVLTVLLIPLTFLAMRWIYPVDSVGIGDVLGHAGLLGLLAANTLFAVLASVRIFRHFLRQTQPTFVAAYVMLSVAGAVVPALPAAAVPFAALFLWLVFAAGAVKVNRHVFWLTEEHRLPRICGFLPILLLGGQFLALFAAGLASHLRLEWIGLGCVLTAIPVLLTADTLARVFLERTGRVTRPLPWRIVLPIFIALVLTVAGVCLAGLRFPQAPLLVPAAGTTPSSTRSAGGSSSPPRKPTLGAAASREFRVRAARISTFLRPPASDARLGQNLARIVLTPPRRSVR